MISWIVMEGKTLKIIKIPKGSFPSNGLGKAPEGFEPGDEKFISFYGEPGAFVLSIDFDSWRDSKSKDNFFTRLKEGWKP